MRDDERLLSVGEIRREYFAPRSRPTKRSVAKWFEVGTVEGARLRGVVLDGELFARAADVEAFLESSRVVAAPQERSRKNRNAAKNAAAETAKALDDLRRMGMKRI